MIPVPRRMLNKVIQTFAVEDCKGHFVTKQQQILKICEDYIEELYDKKNY